MPITELLPTPEESESGWWKQSLRYFEYISKQRDGPSTSKTSEPSSDLIEGITDCQRKMASINDLCYNGQIPYEIAEQQVRLLQQQLDNIYAILQSQQNQNQDPEPPQYNDTVPTFAVPSPADDDFTIPRGQDHYFPTQNSGVQDLNFVPQNSGLQNLNFMPQNTGEQNLLGVDLNFSTETYNYSNNNFAGDYNYNNNTYGGDYNYNNINNFNTSLQPQNLYAQQFQNIDVGTSTPQPQKRPHKPSRFLRSPYVQQLLKKKTPPEIVKLFKQNKLTGLRIQPRIREPWSRDMWRSLLENGWFDTMHIDAWAYIKVVERHQSCKRTILPSAAFCFMGSPGTQWLNYMDGTQSEYPAWYSVSEVLIPINIDNCHWVLTVLNLTTWYLRIYDSLHCERSYQAIEKYVRYLETNLPKYLHAMNFWGHKGLPTPSTWTISDVYVDHVPQQAPGTGDCGAFTCHFMEEIMKEGDITYVNDYEDYNPVELNNLIRMYLAAEFYKYRVD